MKRDNFGVEVTSGVAPLPERQTQWTQRNLVWRCVASLSANLILGDVVNETTSSTSGNPTEMRPRFNCIRKYNAETISFRWNEAPFTRPPSFVSIATEFIVQLNRIKRRRGGGIGGGNNITRSLERPPFLKFDASAISFFSSSSSSSSCFRWLLLLDFFCPVLLLSSSSSLFICLFVWFTLIGALDAGTRKMIFGLSSKTDRTTTTTTTAIISNDFADAASLKC